MHSLPIMLLLDREAFWKTLRRGGVGWAGVAAMAAFVVVTCAVYGAVMAGWRSPRLAFYAAVKLPLLFVGSTSIVALFNWMIASVLGSGLSFRQTLALAFASMTVAGWILLALAPVALFFTLTGVPKTEATMPEEVVFAYKVMLITHVAALALAGVSGNGVLYNGIRATVRPDCSVRSLFASWIALFAIVGCQLSWILRPFVGSPFLEVAFLREDALQGNFFETVFLRLIPNLFH